MNSMKKTCICPECKNGVNLDTYPNLEVGHVIECNVCGITLEVIAVDETGAVSTEIVDEAK